MTINTIFMRLRLFISSPIFFIILAVVVYIAYMIYSTPITLCDDNGLVLNQLKDNLRLEVSKYRTSLLTLDYYTESIREYMKISRPNFRDFNLENTWKNAIVAHNDSLGQIHSLEASIKNIEPGFKTPLTPEFFSSLKRGY